MPINMNEPRLGVCQRAIGNALKRLNISYKKTLSHPKADENTRRIFQDKIEAYQTNKQPIVYLDESGFAHDMPRTHISDNVALVNTIGTPEVGQMSLARDWQAHY